MPDLADVKRFLASETGLAVISTVQADGRVLSSVVNCGVVDHPDTAAPVVAFVSMGTAARVGHIERGSQVTVAVRRGWQWVSVTGTAELVGPDHETTLDAAGIGALIQTIYRSAGGTHDDYGRRPAAGQPRSENEWIEID